MTPATSKAKTATRFGFEDRTESKPLESAVFTLMSHDSRAMESFGFDSRDEEKVEVDEMGRG